MSNYTKEWISGSGKEIKFSNGGSVINISIPEEAFQKIKTFKTQKGDVWRTFSVAEKKEVGKYGDTHSLYCSIKEGEESSSKAKEDDDDFFD